MANRVKIKPFEWANLSDNMLSALQNFPKELAEARELDRQYREGKVNVQELKDEINQTALALAEDEQLRAKAAEAFGVENDPTAVFNAYKAEFETGYNTEDTKTFLNNAMSNQMKVFEKMRLEDPMLLGFLHKKAFNATNAKRGSEAYEYSKNIHETDQYNRQVAGAKTLDDYERIAQAFPGRNVKQSDEYRRLEGEKRFEKASEFVTAYKDSFESGNVGEAREKWLQTGGDEKGWDEVVQTVKEEAYFKDQLQRAKDAKTRAKREEVLHGLRVQNQKLVAAKNKSLIDKAEKGTIEKEDILEWYVTPEDIDEFASKYAPSGDEKKAKAQPKYHQVLYKTAQQARQWLIKNEGKDMPASLWNEMVERNKLSPVFDSFVNKGFEKAVKKAREEGHEIQKEDKARGILYITDGIDGVDKIIDLNSGTVKPQERGEAFTPQYQESPQEKEPIPEKTGLGESGIPYEAGLDIEQPAIMKYLYKEA